LGVVVWVLGSGPPPPTPKSPIPNPQSPFIDLFNKKKQLLIKLFEI